MRMAADCGDLEIANVLRALAADYLEWWMNRGAIQSAYTLNRNSPGRMTASLLIQTEICHRLQGTHSEKPECVSCSVVDAPKIRSQPVCWSCPMIALKIHHKTSYRFRQPVD